MPRVSRTAQIKRFSWTHSRAPFFIFFIFFILILVALDLTMLHLLNEDCLLRISRELVSDLSSSALIPFIQTNRFLYNLASHYLLLCPASYTYSGIHIGLEGDTESDERVEGFRDFVLGVNFYRSRVPHLHRLIVTIPSMEDIEDIEKPRLSKRSINALAEVFNPALHHQPQHAPTAQPPIVLERFAMWPLVDSFGTLDDMFPIPSLLAKIPTLHELVCTSRGTLDSISHQDIKAPLSTLSLEVEDPGTDFRTCDLLVNLSSVRQSLRRLYLNAHECFTFGFTRGTKIPVYPSLLEFVARVWDLHIPTRVLVEAFPNLKNLSLDIIGRSIFPSDCLQWPVDDDASWGMENSLYSHIRRENQRDLEQYGHEQWKELDEVTGSVRTLYSLDLTCKVKTLTIYSDGLYEEDMAQDVCERMKPESLHFLCILTRALPSVTSAIMGCTGSLRDFHLETSLNVEVKNWGSWEIWYAEIVSTVFTVIIIKSHPIVFRTFRRNSLKQCFLPSILRMSRTSTFISVLMAYGAPKIGNTGIWTI